MTLTSPWPGRGWPLRADEEQEFLLQAKALKNTGRKTDEDEISPGVTRGDVTFLVTALRQGTSLEEMLEVTPGLNTRALVKAHGHVSKLLNRALKSWQQIQESGTPQVIASKGDEASKVLPLTITRLRAAVESGSDVRLVLTMESSKVSTVRRHFDDMHAQLAMLSPGPEVLTLSRRVYHPDEECLMQHPRFLPTRVGELSPLRLARLLGEQPIGLEGPPEVVVARNPAVAAARARPGRGRR